MDPEAKLRLMLDLLRIEFQQPTAADYAAHAGLAARMPEILELTRLMNTPSPPDEGPDLDSGGGQAHHGA